MKSAICPSCGAPVVFKSAASIYAVCEYCKSTLLRQGEDLSNLGRMAELLDDPTLLQIGSAGQYKSHPFQVIGRIQLKYAEGLWNEWHVLFGDGHNAWLSEAGGEYTLTRLVPVSEDIPAFETLAPEQKINLAGQEFSVTDLETARCIAGEGELPFKVDAGYDVCAADLRQGNRFASIDYSETPPLVFVGEAVSFAELKFSHLRDKADAGGSKIQVHAFQCPRCAAAIELHAGSIQAVACKSCGSLLDVEDKNLKLISQADAATREQPLLPLGSKGTLSGVAWEVIGYMRRRTVFEGQTYSWSEYLLFHAGEGFAWLTHDQGHWNFLRPLVASPAISREQTSFTHEGTKYRLFNRGRAKVAYVLGEFYWRVRVGESCATADFVAAPLLISREISDKEVNWSRGEYLEPEAVWRAFGFGGSPPKRNSIYGNQPNTWQQPHARVCKAFWLMLLLASALQFGLGTFTSSAPVLKQAVNFLPGNEDAVVSEVFHLNSRARSLAVQHQTSLDNNWLGLTTTLVAKDTGATWQGVQDLSHYQGVEDGEHWSEGSDNDEIVFRNIPAGDYYLSIDVELGKDRDSAVMDTVTVKKDALVWSNYILLLLALAVFPLFSRWRKNAFEAARWEESSIGDDKTDQEGSDDDSGGALGKVAGVVLAGAAVVLDLLTS